MGVMTPTLQFRNFRPIVWATFWVGHYPKSWRKKAGKVGGGVFQNHIQGLQAQFSGGCRVNYDPVLGKQGTSRYQVRLRFQKIDPLPPLSPAFNEKVKRIIWEHASFRSVLSSQ